MFGIVLQFLSIVLLGDFNPALTPGLMEDASVLEPAYQAMQAIKDLGLSSL